MVYKSPAHIHDFLRLQYSDLGFLINRSQFSGSTSINSMRHVKSQLQYFDSLFVYNRERVLLFDLNHYLQSLFGCHPSGDSTMSLLMQPEDFSEQRRPAIMRFMQDNPKLSKRYLGIKITSSAEIMPVSEENLLPMPGSLREMLIARGILGCRFSETEQMEYFIDLESTLINVLSRKLL